MPSGWSLRPTNAEMREKERKAIQGLVEIGAGPAFTAPRRPSTATVTHATPAANAANAASAAITATPRARSPAAPHTPRTSLHGDAADRSFVFPIEGRHSPAAASVMFKKNTPPPQYHPGKECPFEFKQSTQKKHGEVSTYNALHSMRPPSRSARTPSPVASRDPRRVSQHGTEYAFGSITKPKPGALPFGWRMFFTPERRECFIHVDSDRAFWAIPASLAPYPLCRIQQVGPNRQQLPKEWRALRLPDGILVYLQKYAAQAQYDIEQYSESYDETVSSIPQHNVDDSHEVGSTASDVEQAVIYTPLPKRKGVSSTQGKDFPLRPSVSNTRESQTASPSPRASVSPRLAKGTKDMSSAESSYSRRTPSPCRRGSPTSTRASSSRGHPPPPTLPDNTAFKYQDHRIVGVKSTKKHFAAAPTYGIGRSADLQLGTRQQVAMQTTRSRSTEYRERFNPPSPAHHDAAERARVAGVRSSGGAHAQEWRAIAQNIQRALSAA